MTLTKEASSHRLIFGTFPVSIVAFSVPFYLGGWVLMAVYEGKFLDYAYVFSLIVSTWFSIHRMKSSSWKKGIGIRTGGYIRSSVMLYLTFLPMFVWINVMAMMGLEVFFYTDRWYVSLLLLIVTGLFGAVMAGQTLYALTEMGFGPRGK